MLCFLCVTYIVKCVAIQQLLTSKYTDQYSATMSLDFCFFKTNFPANAYWVQTFWF